MTARKSSQQSNDFFQFQNMVSNASFHCWRPTVAIPRSAETQSSGPRRPARKSANACRIRCSRPESLRGDNHRPNALKTSRYHPRPRKSRTAASLRTRRKASQARNQTGFCSSPPGCFLRRRYNKNRDRRSRSGCFGKSATGIGFGWSNRTRSSRFRRGPLSHAGFRIALAACLMSGRWTPTAGQSTARALAG